MKSLNENIGLGGGNGMSHFDGVAVFDPEKDASVKQALKNIESLQAELEASGEKSRYWNITRNAEIQAYYRKMVSDWSPNGIFEPAGTRAINAELERVNSEQQSNISAINSRVNEIKNKLLPEASEVYQNAKIAAIEANNKIVDSQIKVLAEKAKTDPTALEQMTKLNEQKLVGEQALAKQKIEADVAKNKSSNIKIYVIIGAVVIGLAAIAGIWIWLKSRRAV